jgi:hypothetical protein
MAFSQISNLHIHNKTKGLKNQALKRVLMGYSEGYFYQNDLPMRSAHPGFVLTYKTGINLIIIGSTNQPRLMWMQVG